MNRTTLAYCAGVIDSDGCISIKRRRTKNGWTYTGVIQVRQAEKQAVTLCHQIFGGNLRLDPPAKETRRPMHCWQITHRGTVRAIHAILPYLKIKRPQAELILQFAKCMTDARLRRRSHWFVFRDDDELMSAKEAAAIKQVDRNTVYQAIRNGSVPVTRIGRRVFIPSRFWESYVTVRGHHPIPAEYEALREDFWRRSKHMNRTGPR